MGTSNTVQKLRQWCVRHHLDWNDDAGQRFDRYIELLLHYGRNTNLIGYKTAEEIVDHLFIDSLQILRTGAISGPLLDVGTGAGFPSVPIKILSPGIDLLLVEPRTKRYAFLQIVCRELGLSKVRIEAAKIESVPVPKLGFAISKAFAPLPQWIDTAGPWAADGAEIGCLAAEKDWDNALPEIERRYRVGGLLIENSRVYARLSAL